MALLLWPFVALVLTVPMMIVQYRRYNKVIVSRAAWLYGFVLYALGLVFFTLYPMPDATGAFCQQYHLVPQLNVLQFIADIRGDGLRAVLQLAMNVVFFMPLGVFGRLLFGWRFWQVAVGGLLVSVTIETAQLTGAFGLYDCSYRLFDIDDMITNTAGALLGWCATLLIPRKEVETAARGAVVRRPGLARHAVAFLLDYTAMNICTIILLLGVYVIAGNDVAMSLRGTAPIAAQLAVFSVMPLLSKGWSLGGATVRLNYDDVPRTVGWRWMYYTVRAAVVYCLLTPPFGWGWLSTVVVITLIIVWWRRKVLLYQMVPTGKR